MRGLALRLAICAVALGTGPAASRADEPGSALAPARELVSELRYDEAVEMIPALLADGALSAADTAAAYRLGAEVFAAVGRSDDAVDYFERWLVLVPDGELPSGVSPKISAPFEKARARVRSSGPLRVRPVATRARDTVTVEIVVDSDPLDMARGLRVDGESSDELSLELRVPGSDAVRISVAVTDASGNELLALQVEVAPASALVHTEPREPAAHRRPWYAQWYTWAGVAAASAGAGVYFGLSAKSDADDLAALNANSASHSFDEARAVERRGKRNALLANISFGASGAALVATVICAWRGTTEEPVTTVEPIAGAGVTGLAWRVRF